MKPRVEGQDKGIMLILLVAFFQATLITLVKFAGQSITTGIQVFSYCSVPLVFYIFKAKRYNLKSYLAKHYKFFLIRGFFSSSAVFCFFYAAQHIQLGIASVMYNSSPVFIPFLAAWFLKEKTSLSVYVAIFLALLGVVIIVNPSANGFKLTATAIALLSGLFMAIQQTMLRAVAKTKIDSNVILFYQCLACSFWALVILLVESQFFLRFWHKQFVVHGNVYLTGLLIPVLGGLSYLAQKMVTKAFSYLPAAMVAPFLLVSVPISSLYGWFLWGQSLNKSAMLGIALVFVGVVLVSINNKKNKMNLKKGGAINEY